MFPGGNSPDVSPGAADRLRENATAVTSTVVTGVWLAALFTGQEWWLAALLFGYIAVVPPVAMLFGDEEDVEEWWDEAVSGIDGVGDSGDPDAAPAEPTTDSDARDTLETLRDRYARGELTDEQFERKLERLLETESLEDVEDRYGRERRETEPAGVEERGTECER